MGQGEETDGRLVGLPAQPPPFAQHPHDDLALSAGGAASWCDVADGPSEQLDVTGPSPGACCRCRRKRHPRQTDWQPFSPIKARHDQRSYQRSIGPFWHQASSRHEALPRLPSAIPIARTNPHTVLIMGCRGSRDCCPGARNWKEATRCFYPRRPSTRIGPAPGTLGRGESVGLRGTTKESLCPYTARQFHAMGPTTSCGSRPALTFFLALCFQRPARSLRRAASFARHGVMVDRVPGPPAQS